MFNKGKTDIQVRFDKGEGVQQYAPGEMLAGKVIIRVEEALQCNSVDIQIGWRTEGKGDTDRERIWIDTVPVDEIMPGIGFSHDFSCELPEMPHSYNGELIQITWGVSVKIDVEHRMDVLGVMDISHTQGFIVRH